MPASDHSNAIAFLRFHAGVQDRYATQAFHYGDRAACAASAREFDSAADALEAHDKEQTRWD